MIHNGLGCLVNYLANKIWSVSIGNCGSLKSLCNICSYLKYKKLKSIPIGDNLVQHTAHYFLVCLYASRNIQCIGTSILKKSSHFPAFISVTYNNNLKHIFFNGSHTYLLLRTHPIIFF